MNIFARQFTNLERAKFDRLFCGDKKRKILMSVYSFLYNVINKNNSKILNNTISGVLKKYNSKKAKKDQIKYTTFMSYVKTLVELKLLGFNSDNRLIIDLSELNSCIFSDNNLNKICNKNEEKIEEICNSETASNEVISSYSGIENADKYKYKYKNTNTFNTIDETGSFGVMDFINSLEEEENEGTECNDEITETYDPKKPENIKASFRHCDNYVCDKEEVTEALNTVCADYRISHNSTCYKRSLEKLLKSKIEKYGLFSYVEKVVEENKMRSEKKRTAFMDKIFKKNKEEKKQQYKSKDSIGGGLKRFNNFKPREYDYDAFEKMYFGEEDNLKYDYSQD